jgi:hypothetical protein
MRDKTELYYECHVTLEPPNAIDRLIVEEISAKHGFRMARFNTFHDGEQAKGFTSSRSESYADIVIRAKALCDELNAAKFYVQRCKVEETIFDTKFNNDDPLRFRSTYRSSNG